MFKATYERLIQISPNKPLMIAETSSTERGGSKAEWIADALTEQLPKQFPQVEAVVRFNWNTDKWIGSSNRRRLPRPPLRKASLPLTTPPVSSRI